MRTTQHSLVFAEDLLENFKKTAFLLFFIFLLVLGILFVIGRGALSFGVLFWVGRRLRFGSWIGWMRLTDRFDRRSLRFLRSRRDSCRIQGRGFLIPFFSSQGGGF